MRPNESDFKDVDQQELIVALTTVADIERAKSLAHQIIEQRLVACCNIVPGISSIFRWQQELCDQQECLLVMKTIKSRSNQLAAFFRSAHPYEVPELITLPVTNCINEYLSWVKQETSDLR